MNYAVRLSRTGTLIGRLEATIVEGRAEVAYLFDPQFWGQGYATEAMSAFHDHLQQNEHVSEFWATTAPRNVRSIRLLDRLGYAPAPEPWPRLLSYEKGDLVFVQRSFAPEPRSTPFDIRAGRAAPLGPDTPLSLVWLPGAEEQEAQLLVRSGAEAAVQVINSRLRAVPVDQRGEPGAAGALRRIDVKQHAALPAQSSNGAHVLHDARFVVDVHD